MGNPQPPSIPYPLNRDKRLEIIRRNDEYVRRHIYALEDAQARRLKAMLEQSRDKYSSALVNAIMQNGGTWAYDSNYNQRTAAMMRVITQELDDLIRDASGSTMTAMEAAYKGGYYGKAWVMDDALRGAGVINLPMLPSAAIRSALLSPYGGMTFLDRFADARDDFVRRIRKAIVQSQINGDSIPVAVKRLADELGINVGRGGVERGLRARLEMIARTEILRASNLGAMAIYEANQDVLQGWEWVATKDERTCDICGPKDGNADIGGKPHAFDSGFEKPPAHPNCRCSVVPVLIDEAFEARIVGKHMTWSEWKARKMLFDTGVLQNA
jgi:SPP1 gp7 family putative phage head morphogenesis protein